MRVVKKKLFSRLKYCNTFLLGMRFTCTYSKGCLALFFSQLCYFSHVTMFTQSSARFAKLEQLFAMCV